MSENKLKPETMLVILVVGLIAGGLLLTFINSKTVIQNTQIQQTESETNKSTQTTQISQTAQTFKYQNGTYKAQSTYTVPEGGKHTITVTMSVQDDKVTDVSFTQTDIHGESAEYEEKFEKAYEAKVVGKSLDGISLSRVGGATLTTNAFTKALSLIKSDAQ